MKKIIISSFFILFALSFLGAQTYTATLSIGNVDLDGIKPGDDVVVPVKLVKKSGGLIAGFQFFIEFNHNILSWKGTYQEPLTGVKNLYKNMQYSSDWLFNDNGNAMVALWTDPKNTGVNMDNNDIFFEYVFTYKGGLSAGSDSPLVWENESLVKDGHAMKGITELYSELLDYFVITRENGSVYMK